MINRVSTLNSNLANRSITKKGIQNNNVSNTVQYTTNSVDAGKLASAYRGYNKIRLASSINFTSSFASAFDELNKSMITCRDEEHGRKGEEVGKRIGVTTLLARYFGDLPKYDDAIKTTIKVNERTNNKKEHYITEARTQVKKGNNNDAMFEMIVRGERKDTDPIDKTNITQTIRFNLEPYHIGHDPKNHKRIIEGTEESAYVLNTKGKLMAVVEDEDNVLLTSTGSFKKKNPLNGGKLEVFTNEPGKDYKEYKVDDVVSVRPKSGTSQGGGTEIIIGLEDGRFVKEIISSIAEFCDKVDRGEIVLDEFVPAPNAQKIQLSMLAGGFGSRAEYTNASSSKIFHGVKDGSNLTKGCFRTATGLTPMETTFISLHKAGLLDCSKGNLGIGKNIKFYLNNSGQNGGNGGFTVDMYNTMAREGRESLLILPNDAMSRIPHALNEMSEIMNSGKAAMVMVAKEVSKETAAGKFGIMRISDDGQITEFAEKLSLQKIEEQHLADENGNCYANTFQFMVSKEAFNALESLEQYMPANNSGKEPRDWSKTLTPILMALVHNDNAEDMQKEIIRKTELTIPTSALETAKNILGDQKIYAVKTNEPWADCGTLHDLYYTTMEIASGKFPLEDFERKHVLDSVNTETGLVASNPEQKEKIEDEYEIHGQVMAVPKAQAVPDSIIDDYAFAITKYKD